MNKPKILFIGTSFFNIEKYIIKSFEKNGFNVDYYNDRPSESSLVKGIIKLNTGLFKPFSNLYFSKILKKTINTKYSKVFILNGKIINRDLLLALKSQQTQAEFILYTYDSLDLYPNTLESLDLYDRAYSFDSIDSEKHENVSLLPLFFNEKVEELSAYKNFEYDLLSICTAHPNRYSVIKDLFPKLKSEEVKIFSFLYLNRLQYLYNIFSIPQFKSSKKSEFNFKPLKEEENLKLISKSKALFDVEHSRQSGLTMRTIESLGSKRKLITTNTEIKKYNFYTKSNILVLSDVKNLKEIKAFLDKPYTDLDIDVYNQYKLAYWSRIILGIEERGCYFK